MNDQVEIYLQSWTREEPPKAIIQIAHGMAEHIDRYDDFARFLVQKGIYVFGNDHRGHGKTGEKMGNLGYFSEKDGFDRGVLDLYHIFTYIKDQYPNIPYIILGHSMGSFLVRRLIQKFPDISFSAVILSGTAGNPGIAGKLGQIIAKREMKKLGKTAQSHLMNKLIFGAYDKAFKDEKSIFSWISSDKNTVKEYIDDPLCGFVCSTSFYYELLRGLELIHKDEEVAKVNKKLPLFIFSGEEDPVGAKTRGVKKVIEQYKKHGISEMDYKFYQGGRHEMLNEINKMEVYDDVYEWITRWI